MLYSLVVAALTSGLLGGLREMDHPGHKQFVYALANILLIGLVILWFGGQDLR